MPVFWDFSPTVCFSTSAVASLCEEKAVSVEEGRKLGLHRRRRKMLMPAENGRYLAAFRTN
jgi:hypothetical protein